MPEPVATMPACNRLVDRLPATVPFIAPEALERALGRPLELRLGANENPFGPSPVVRETIARAAATAGWYGDPECHELRQELSRHHGVPPENIQVGSGIDDLLGLAVRCVLDPGDVAVMSDGTYPTFAYHVRGYGGRVEAVPYRADLTPDLAGLVDAAWQTDAKVVYLANPDNPSGSWRGMEEVAAFVAALPPGAFVFLDEAYADFAPEVAGSLPDPRVLHFRTFSKAHGLAGLRVGYVLANPEFVRATDKVRLHFGVNRVAQQAAVAALGDVAYLRDLLARIAAERARLASLAVALGWAALPSATNFVAVDVGSAARSVELVATLLDRGVFLRRPGVPPLDRCVRISVGTPEDQRRLAAVLADVGAGDGGRP